MAFNPTVYSDTESCKSNDFKGLLCSTYLYKSDKYHVQVMVSPAQKMHDYKDVLLH